MKILPDEIPADTASLTDESIALTKTGGDLLYWEGKNVHVELWDGRFFTGLLRIKPEYIFVGPRDSSGYRVTYYYVGQSDAIDPRDIVAYREV
jgi:hypothetical protein